MTNNSKSPKKPTGGKNTASTSTAATSLPSETQKRIERRAYELYFSRGQQSGRDVQNWLDAERELLSEGQET